ncbi:signal peptide peptidase SppA [Methylohalobius crimeensis]|uniref:signal peptide peptidase SppA n=1 Tax=Methylohalobius crimeensis TaxID=244365 RepID=UPI0003B5A88F|nr:signal peptide peptidase SppA [Methylohalobius crimeensis]
MAQESETRSEKSPQESPWERDVLEKLALEGIAERRRARRWNIFFKLLFFAYLVAITVSALRPWPEMVRPDGKVTARVDVKGILMEDSRANAETLIKGLRRASSAPNARGILLKMNSPGGSPVQAAYVYEAIRRIKQEKPDLPIVAVVTDVCASGCYYIAAAADKIYVNPASVVGSIGVIMNGFGLVETLQKLGVERRLLTAGEHKALLDPFSPVNPEEKAHVQRLLDRIHRQFIDAVKQGRGERLKDDPDLFSGLVWTGSQSVDLGLVDGIGDSRYVAEEIFGAKKIVDFTPKEDVLERLSRRIGTTLGTTLGQVLTNGWGALR